MEIIDHLKYKEREFEFKQELKQKLHQGYLWDGLKKPRDGKFAITDEWIIGVRDGSYNSQIERVIKNFCRFMKSSFGVRIKTKKVSNIYRIKEQDRVILLKCQGAEGDREIGLKKGESYSLLIEPDKIVITGFAFSGIQYGLYYLEDLMAQEGAPFLKSFVIKREPIFHTRILRSFFSPYYKDELLDDEDYYPEEYLNRLSHHGINGVWIRGILRDLVKSRIFSEFGKNSEDRIEKLNGLVKKCRDFGIKVYIYLNEPMGFSEGDKFWKRYPHIKGDKDFSEMDKWKTSYAMCTSVKETLNFLEDSSETLFENVPDLGGVFLITASEHHTHCYSHVFTNIPGEDKEEQKRYGHKDKIDCPRCKNREPSEMISEVVKAIENGVHSANKEAEVIVWNWSWNMYEPDPQKEIIASLPDNIILMPDFERGGKKQVMDKKVPIDEYSLSYIGPSGRFLGNLNEAEKRNLKMFVKLQFVTTHENATVPYLPLPYNVYQKFDKMHKLGISGFLGCWIMGNYPSMITYLASQLYFTPFPENKKELLHRVAVRYFGKEAAGGILKAWQYFSKGMDNLPFSQSLIKYAPTNSGPAYRIFLKPVDKPLERSWLLGDEPGDRFSDCLGPFTINEFIEAFENVLKFWREGLEFLEKAVNKHLTKDTIKEYTVSKAVYHQFKSTLNVARFYKYRERWIDSKGDKGRITRLQNIKKILTDEIENSLACKRLAEFDSRLRYHSEAFGYKYSPGLIDERVKRLNEILNVEIPSLMKIRQGAEK